MTKAEIKSGARSNAHNYISWGTEVHERMSPSNEIFTVTELAEHLRVHPTTIYRLLRRGHLPGFRVGATWRFSRDAIEKWERSRGMAELEALREEEAKEAKT